MPKTETERAAHAAAQKKYHTAQKDAGLVRKYFWVPDRGAAEMEQAYVSLKAVWQARGWMK